MKKFFKSLRRNLKRRFDLIHNERLKLSILQAVPFWVASILTGLVAVGYTKLFGYAEALGAKLFAWHHWILLIQAPLFFFISWFIIKTFATSARGSGIPQVMAAIDLITQKKQQYVEKLLSLKVAVVKIVSTLFMAAGGGVVGREGPTIQISASIFKFVHKFIPKSWPRLSQQNMIVGGAAAGLAAAFNTPLGGIVFAVEELSKTHLSFYRTALFSAVIIAGLTAQALLGPYLYLGYPDVSNTSWFVYFIIILVAIAGGILGSYMCRIILWLMKWRSKFSLPLQLAYLFACAIIIASLGLFVSTSVLGSGKNVMEGLLFTSVKNPPWYVFPLRFFGPVICFSAGSSGGIFAPGLSAGATLGASMAHWFHLQTADTNLVILAGMVSFLTGITRTPFTSAILVLEMTDRHSVIFHLMLAGMIAGIASMIIDKKSFYDHLKHDYIREFSQQDKVAFSTAQEKKEKAITEKK